MTFLGTINFFGDFVWNLVNANGGGVLAGIVAAAVFAVPMVALWRARAAFAN